MVCNISGPSGSFIGRERQRSRTATLPLPDKAVGVFCLYDQSDLNIPPEEYVSYTEAETMGVIPEEEQAGTVLDNGAVEDSCADPREKRDAESRVTDPGQDGNGFSFSNPAFQTDGKLDTDGDKTEGDLNEDPGIQSRAKHAEHAKKENEFSFSNPAFISKDKQSVEGKISQERSQVAGDTQNEKLLEERQSNRSDSSRFSEGYVSSPETDSVNSIECAHTETKVQKEQTEYSKQEICAPDYTSPQTRPRSLSSRRGRGSSFAKGTDTSYCGVSVIVEEVNEHEMKSSKTSKTWTDWFKTPMFYKVGYSFRYAHFLHEFLIYESNRK